MSVGERLWERERGRESACRGECVRERQCVWGRECE